MSGTGQLLITTRQLKKPHEFVPTFCNTFFLPLKQNREGHNLHWGDFMACFLAGTASCVLIVWGAAAGKSYTRNMAQDWKELLLLPPQCLTMYANRKAVITYPYFPWNPLLNDVYIVFCVVLIISMIFVAAVIDSLSFFFSEWRS